MPLIVIDGIDGSGKSLQVKLTLEYLSSLGINYYYKHYPDYEQPIGSLIKKYLNKEFEFPIQSVFLLFFADIIKDKETLNKLKRNNIVILDRYFTSTVAYQAAQGLDMEKLIKMIETFEPPTPDLIILIDLDPEKAIERKIIQSNNLDRFENIEFLKKVRQNFLKLAEMKFLCNNWIIINGDRSPEEIFSEIKRYINKVLENVCSPK